MGISETVKELSKVTKIAFENYVKFKNAEIRKLQKEEHVLTEDCEIVVPSREEIYAFEKKFWNLDIEDNYIIISKNKEEGKIDMK